MSEADLAQIAREHSEAREVVKSFLKELNLRVTEQWLDRNANALLARLAHGGFVLEKVRDA